MEPTTTMHLLLAIYKYYRYCEKEKKLKVVRVKDAIKWIEKEMDITFSEDRKSVFKKMLYDVFESQQSQPTTKNKADSDQTKVAGKPEKSKPVSEKKSEQKVVKTSSEQQKKATKAEITKVTKVEETVTKTTKVEATTKSETDDSGSEELEIEYDLDELRAFGVTSVAKRKRDEGPSQFDKDLEKVTTTYKIPKKPKTINKLDTIKKQMITEKKQKMQKQKTISITGPDIDKMEQRLLSIKAGGNCI
jgi:hypothetical protein